MRRGKTAGASARCGVRAQGAQRTFLLVAVLIFGTCTAVTILECASMSAAGAMTMPGGGAMSMAWMRMPGESWAAAFGSFLVMWLVMMVAMMLPSLIPPLWAYRARVGRLDLTLLVSVGYFAVSTTLGAALFPLGATLAALQMHWPLLAQATPGAAGLIVVAAGLLQCTRWKAHHLACCREGVARRLAAATDRRSAWRSGLRLGRHCGCCCAPQLAVLLVTGLMDLRAMVLVSGVITAERLLVAGPRIARIAGAVAVGVGALAIVRAAEIG
jgi:predicted metal-binding membrane protein